MATINTINTSSFSTFNKFNAKKYSNIDTYAKAVFAAFKNAADKNAQQHIYECLKTEARAPESYANDSFIRKIISFFYFVFGIQTKTEKILDEMITILFRPVYEDRYEEVKELTKLSKEEFVKSCLYSKDSYNIDDEKFYIVRKPFAKGGQKKASFALSGKEGKVTVAMKSKINVDFETEIKVQNILKKCGSDVKDHFNLMIGYQQHEEKVVMFVPLCNQGHLRTYMESNSNRISLAGKADASKQMITGLKFLHQLGIYHLDIKPENILVHIENDKISVKIIDFGLATFRDSPEENFGLRGTPLWADPFYLDRTLVKKKRFDLADVWSLGAVLYLWLTEKYPIWFQEDIIGYIPQFSYTDGRWVKPENSYEQVIAKMLLPAFDKKDNQVRPDIATIQAEWDKIP